MARASLSLKARALRYLSQREHSRLELARKLQPYVQEGDDLEALLQQLEANKWLSQERFSESLVHRRAGRYGNSRILAELSSHGIEGEAIAELKTSLAGDEAERALAVWQRKFGAVAQDAEQRARQTRFLLQRGFSQRAIRTALKGEAT
jgi:regulatory protein